MHRIDGPGATIDNLFTEGDPGSGVPATNVTDDWLNDVQEEIASVVEDAGIALVKGQQDQLLAAIRSMVTASPGYVNLLHNGDFRFWQRGLSHALTDEEKYTADRWKVDTGDGGVVTASRQAFVPGQVSVPGNPLHHLRHNQSTQASATRAPSIQQRIEHVGTGAGGTLTASFYAKVNAGSVQVTPRLRQYFGSGGGASSPVNTDGAGVTVTTDWTRFSATFSVPAITGKTLDGGNDFLALVLLLPSSATFILDVADAQVEPGGSAGTFERRPDQVELPLCARFFAKSYELDTKPGSGTVPSPVIKGAHYWLFDDVLSLQASSTVRLPVELRANPTVTIYSPQGSSGKVSNYALAIEYAVSVSGVNACTRDTGQLSMTSPPSVLTPMAHHYTADAEL